MVKWDLEIKCKIKLKHKVCHDRVSISSKTILKMKSDKSFVGCNL